MWTGVLPDEHGIHDGFYVFDTHEYRMRIVRPDEIPEPFWMAASRSGRRLLLVDIPYTFLSPRINGVQMCDCLVHVRSDKKGFTPFPPRSPVRSRETMDSILGLRQTAVRSMNRTRTASRVSPALSIH